MKYGKFIEIKGLRVGDINFIAKAQSDDETRYFMNFIYCEDSKLIATDGRRLHMMELSEGEMEFHGFKPDTFYRFLKGTKTVCWLAEIDNSVENMVFPNYKRVIPDKEDTVKTKFVNKSNKLFLYENLKNISKSLPDDAGLDIRYLFDLPKDRIFTVYVKKDIRAMALECDSLTAIVMPRSIDTDWEM